MASKPESATSEKFEERPDGWDRFRRAVHAAAESGPKHKIALKAKERPASKGRVHKGKARD
jgi:hypothetical protein